MRRADLGPLRGLVLDANVELYRRGLALFTFGNASAIDRASGLVVIKPSGVAYDALTADGLVVTDLDGRTIEGGHRPSSDLPTHLALYRAFGSVSAITHTHSHFATVFAQAHREIPCLGTTHADYFHGPIPVTGPLRREEIADDYEANTGRAIVSRFVGLDQQTMPAVLVAGHASFCWGDSAAAAVETACVLEEVARLAYHTLALDRSAEEIGDALRDKHYFRKHGPGAYYGQGNR